jgi:hypothetical protein
MRTGGSYSQSMGGRRVIPMLIAAIMLLLRGGECVSPLFADQQTRECCTRGTCSPAHKSDPCCEFSNSTTVKHFQAETRVAIPSPSDAGFAVLSETVPQLVSSDRRFSLISGSVQPPGPGVSSRTPLPLLI